MKKFRLAILLFVFLSLPVVLCACQENDGAINSYSMSLSYDDEDNILQGNELVEYHNNSDNAFDAVYFHLYPNAYRSDAKKKIISSANVGKAYPNGDSDGFIQVEYVKNLDEDFDYSIEGEDENILKVNLRNILYPDEMIKIEIGFFVKFANINHRLGYGENTINIGNFYPIACVYENGKGFRKDLYSSNGDPFYSEVANYELNFTFPSEYKIASSGEVVASEKIDNLIKIALKSEKMRDFSLILSKKFKIESEMCGKTKINYYGYQEDENTEECLKACVDALKTFSDAFGDYPYSELNIAKSNFVYGGMEYPGLVIISDEYKNQKDINYVIVHEIAHQWWYAVVGSDQIGHAWQDEGLAEFSTLLFFKNNAEYGENYKDMISSATASYKLFEKVYKNIRGYFDGRMDRTIYDFDTEPEYTQLTYTKALLMFDSIMQDIGEKKLIRGLKKYYEEFAFSIAQPEGLIDCLCKGSGYNLESYIFSWIEGKVVI